jgi:hypothetical protein
MEKAPRSSLRKSTRHRALQRDAKHLRLQLEAYNLQAAEKLRELYDREPDAGYWDSIADREAELWGPLLIHARLAGPEAEGKLLAVVDKFGEEKAAIKSQDWKIAQTVDLLDAITKHSVSTFTPGELVPSLLKSEAWAKKMAEVKGRDDDSILVARAAKVGYALRQFRLKGRMNSAGRMAYDRQAAIDCLSAHVPSNPLYSLEPLSNQPLYPQANENKPSPEGAESTEGSPGIGRNMRSGLDDASLDDGWEDLKL